MDTSERAGIGRNARTARRNAGPGGPGSHHHKPPGPGTGVNDNSRRTENAGALDALDALDALVRVRMTAGVDPDCFEARLRLKADIAEAWRLAGDCDFEVLLSCRSLADLDAMVAQLRDAGGVTSTILVLHRVRLET